MHRTSVTVHGDIAFAGLSVRPGHASLVGASLARDAGPPGRQAPQARPLVVQDVEVARSRR